MDEHRASGAVPGATPVDIERADRFLKSTGGRAAVHRILAVRRLPHTLADDLAQEALRRVAEATERGTVIENPEGFVTQALHFAAVDILRGRIRTIQSLAVPPAVDPDAEERGWSHHAIDSFASPLDVEVEALAFESIAAVRRAVHQRLGPDPAAAAAALAYIAVVVDGAPTPPDCPQPIGGASPQEAADWAGLWYAGRDDCFPTHDGMTAPAAMRKRRSRASKRFHGLLKRAAVAAGLAPVERTARGYRGASSTTPVHVGLSGPADGSHRGPSAGPVRRRQAEAAIGG
jgi:DNA-directed RNA polymerase specialized sigma24 family protein